MAAAFLETGFDALGIPAPLLAKVKKLGYAQPSPIQQQAIPIALQGHDLIGIAQTGTGKTLAFSVPMLANLYNHQQGLVLVPTRELAVQVSDSLRQMGVRTAVVIGGAPMHTQVRDLAKYPKVIVATPGRLIDHMLNEQLDLFPVGVVVLDEADRMLDMGFETAIRQILDATLDSRQTLLFSATMPEAIQDISRRYMVNPKRVEVARQGTVAEKVEHLLIVVHKDEKPEVLRELAYEHDTSILVFTRTRHGARKLAESLRKDGHESAELHSDRTLNQRMAALYGFKRGEVRILVATDIAARGIDVQGIGLVLNYDVPENAEDYVHRIGRTARAGASGIAITLVSPEQHRDVRDIEKLIQSEIPVSERSTKTLPSPDRAFGKPGSKKRKPFRKPK